MGDPGSRFAPVPSPPPVQQGHIDAIAKVEAAVLGERSPGERAVRWSIRKVGTPTSVVAHGVALSAWIAWNAGLHGSLPAFDPAPFPLLSLLASVEAILLGLLILTSQNRLQHEVDRRAHLTLQIGMMAEREGTEMLQMLNRLCRQAGVAGAAGSLYAAWGGFISPTVFALSMSAQVIISVLVGGLGTLLGPILGAVLIQYLINIAGTQHAIDPNLGLGLVLVVFVLLVPQGLVPVARGLVRRLAPRPAIEPAPVREIHL
jgi:uncharacterized membrane protein